MTVGVGRTTSQLCSTLINVYKRKNDRKNYDQKRSGPSKPSRKPGTGATTRRTYPHTCCREAPSRVCSRGICSPLAPNTSYTSRSTLRGRKERKTVSRFFTTSMGLSSRRALETSVFIRGTCAGPYAVIRAFLSEVAVSAVLAQMARVSGVADTLSISQTSPLPLAATQASTHTTGA